MNATLQFLLAHRDWLIWPLLSALLAVLSRKKTAQEWEAWALQQPVGALVIEVARAAGFDLPKIFVALKRYSDRRAGKVAEDAFARLPVSESLRKTLADPAARAQIESIVREFTKAP